MKQITFYFDVISPYAYLAFEHLPQALQGLSYGVVYRPVLFGAILTHYGQLGPAEMAPKRTWTYRQVQWLARQHGIGLDMPANHPFNSISLLRMAIACGNSGACNRFVAETLFGHVWRGGLDASDPNRLPALIDQLCPARSLDDASVKAELKSNTTQAIENGVFGVPTIEVDEQLFWGVDALPMLRAYLLGDDWFAAKAWHTASTLPIGVIRQR